MGASKSKTKMIRSYNYIPLHNGEQRSDYYAVSFSKIAWTTVSMPLFAFLFCVIWSVIFDFESATSTHCNVFNFLPSISAAIGNYTPQRHVWRIAIALHAGPRFLVAFMYFKYHIEVLYPWAHFFSTTAFTFNIIENLSLIGLTFWSSSENYPVHKLCFLTFIFTSELYMLLVCIILQRCRMQPGNNIEARSLKVKWKLLAFNIICFLTAGYFFMRHNSFCEPGVYSLFALFEYFVVLSNMCFHMTAYWDFYGKNLVFDKYGIHYTNIELITEIAWSVPLSNESDVIMQ